MLVPMALGGTVYVNGVDVSTLRNQTFEGVTVTFDARGDVHIAAPRYAIQASEVDGASPANEADEPAPLKSVGVPIERYWLATQDEASAGHVLDIYINARHVRTVRSGEAQVILDLGPYLQVGANSVRVQVASETPGGGPLYVHIGTGLNNEGTLELDTPQIQHAAVASDPATLTKEYTLTVHP